MSVPPGGRLWPEHWAVQADLEADRIQHRLNIATARDLTPSEMEARAAVEHHVTEARTACRSAGRFGRRGMLDRWRGASVERAYLHLHSAKIFLVDVLPEPEFAAIVPEVATRLGQALGRNDPRRVEGERALQTSTGPVRRAAVKQAMEIAYDASDEEYTRLRDFRNIIVLAAAAITLLTGLLIFFVAQTPDAVPMCFDPAVTAPPDAGQAVTAVAPNVCPRGAPLRPGRADILIISGLGALGGALGALIAIRRLRGTSTPYSVSTALAVLKVPSGALTAIIGMLLLAGGFVPGLTNLDSQRQILAYALLFGLAQHLVTRVADNRAQQLMDNIPSKDPEAKPAEPPVAMPSAPPAPPTDPPGEVAAAPVEATGEFLPPQEVDGLVDELKKTDEELEIEEFPLRPEEPDEFPDDDGDPEVGDEELAQTGTDRGVG
ncbi:hypothetical protein [Actinoplanes sp. NPDC049265]|uniref:hypothetical protein n=1 Tax=Actinoplanes sp. NPDC049265 TaxID=3363902 RepID=UPI00371D4ADE